MVQARRLHHKKYFFVNPVLSNYREPLFPLIFPAIMTPRIEQLRRRSLDAKPSISPERASLITDFYLANEGKYSIPVMRAKSFYYLCEKKTICVDDGELIVGERGPCGKAVPTYPELTCHSLEDLRILDSRPKTSYRVSPECLRV